MKTFRGFVIGICVAISLSVFAASLWPNGAWLETFQNGFLFGNGSVFSALNNVATFNDKRLDVVNKDLYFQEDFEGESISFTCGNGLSVSNETTSPISGNISKRITQSLTNPGLGNNCESQNIDLEDKQKGVLNQICLSAIDGAFQGTNAVFDLIAYDVTNTKELNRISIDDGIKTYCLEFVTNTSTEQITYRLEVVNLQGPIGLLFDDVQIRTDPLPTTNTKIENNYRIWGSATRSTNNTAVPYYANVQYDNQGALFSVDNSSLEGLSITILRDTKIEIVMGGMYGGTSGGFGLTLNSSELSTNLDLTDFTKVIAYSSGPGSNLGSNAVFVGKLQKGDVVTPHLNAGALNQDAANYISIKAEAEDNGLVIKNRTDSSSVENVFSARIQNNGTCTILEQNVPFIESCNRFLLGQTTLTWKSGFFTETPSCTLGGRGVLILSSTPNTTSQNILTKSLSSNPSDGDLDYNITCVRQGTDYVKETDKVYTVPVTNLVENVFSAYIEAADGSPEVITENSPWIDSITDNGVGDYTINFKAGFFTVAPSVIALASTTGTSGLTQIQGSVSTNSVRIETINVNGDNQERDFYIAVQKQGSDYIEPKGVYLGTFGQPTAIITMGPNSSVNLGSDVTVPLDSIEGDRHFVNFNNGFDQFTLDPGHTYCIEYDFVISFTGPGAAMAEVALKRLNIPGVVTNSTPYYNQGNEGAGTVNGKTCFVTNPVDTQNTFEFRGSNIFNSGTHSISVGFATPRAVNHGTVKITKVR